MIFSKAARQGYASRAEQNEGESVAKKNEVELRAKKASHDLPRGPPLRWSLACSGRHPRDRAAPIRENVYPMVVNKRLQRAVRIYAYAALTRGVVRRHDRD